MSSEIEAGLDEYLANAGRLVEAAKMSKGDGSWTPSMIIGHLLDAARVNTGRIYTSAAGGEPSPNWDQEGMVGWFGYAGIPLDVVSADFLRGRQAFVDGARAILAAGNDGAYIKARLDGTAEHDAEHLQQLRGG